MGQAERRAGVAEVQAARLVLERMGVRAEELVGTASTCPEAPTFAEYIPRVSEAVSAGARRVYASYWKRVLQQWGERRLDEPSPSEIKQLVLVENAATWFGLVDRDIR